MSDNAKPVPDTGFPKSAPAPSSNVSTLAIAGPAAAPLRGPLLSAGGLPEQFGRYQVRRQLGKGGMGTVFLAHDTQIDRLVALKVPHPEVAHDPHALERFFREARSAGRLRHPHLCPVYDVGQIDGTPYLTMAYIDGGPLSSRLSEFHADPRRAAAFVRQVALALEEAHGQGIVHRDLKPGNIMVTPRGEPVVMDFGLARRVEAHAAGQTTPGLILGTPAYMPPEQATGDVDAVGPRSDVYSLGVVLYELLTGRLPFQGTTTAVLVQVVHDAPPPPSGLRAGLDPRLECACLRAMAKKSEDRFATMSSFAAALDAYLHDEPAADLADAAALDPRLEDTILELLRAWGWQIGLAKVREHLGEHPAEAAGVLLGWLAGDRDRHAEAHVRFHVCPRRTVLGAWALVGQALGALRAFDFAAAEEAVAELTCLGDTGEQGVAAHLAYLNGYLLSRKGSWEQAVMPLGQALALFGREHPMSGRVLDLLARIYAGKSNFAAAREFYDQALQAKQAFADEAGQILTHEELGRLYLDFGQLDKAEEQLHAGLRVAQKAQDEAAQAQLFNHLGRVALARAEAEAAAGKRAAARRLYGQAAEYLDWSIQYNEARGRAVQEGRVHKDRAIVCLADGNLAAAEDHLDRGEALLQEANFARGLAEVRRSRGVIRRAQGRHDESAQLLRQALAHYDATHQQADAARTQLELARTLLAAGSPARVASQAFLDALERAEACRRTELVRVIEEELKGVDEDAHWRHVHRRLRGRGAPEDTSALDEGMSEQATVLFLNLQGFTPFCLGLDPGEVMLALNQLLGDLASVLERHRAQVTAYLGGGFMALLREANHAGRAVHAALDLLKVVEEFNRPRQVLGLRLLPARIGVATGSVFLGNIGTYHKMDFTAVGVPVNLASRLMREGDVMAPCISRETRDQLRDDFLFRDGNPRVVELKGIGRREVWDVVGRKREQTPGPTMAR